MENADMPAMPVSLTDNQEAGAPYYAHSATGLTKREMMAMHILAGFLSDYEFDVTKQTAAEMSVEQADALLAELERTK